MQTAMGKTVLAGSNMVAPQRAALPQRAAVQGAPVVARRQLHSKAGRKAQQITAAAPAAVAEKAEPKFKAEAISDSKINDAVNAIRFLAIDAVNKANSGHPGLPMGAAPMAYLLFNEYMTHNPKSPAWFNRDRFVLSAGHGSMLQYALMHFAGYESVTIEDCKQFRQWHSRTPGHPENFETEGVEVTTGPLGQGIANAVGLALAEAHLGARFNKPGEAKVVDHYTYCILGDGCNMEGISNEAASLAGHWGLGKLIALYDDNRISIDGHTDISFTEDVAKRFEALGWHVQHVQDGNLDMAGLRKAIEAAKAVTDKPSMIKVSTLIGYGSPNKADSHDVHGAALGKDETAATRENLKWPHAPFEFPDSVYETFSAAQKKGKAAEEEWKKTMDAYKQKHPEDYAELAGLLSRELPAGWESALTDIEFKEGDNKATRQWSNMMLNALAPVLPGLIGGSADLAPSNLTLMKAFGDFQSPNHGSGGYAERNLRFGVREHAMGAIANGIALHNSGLLPYTATFFIFTDYMKNAIRMSAISQAGVIYVMTHDSIGLGEDGPTHQPIEQLATYRAQPNTLMLRPGDGRETAAAYKIAVENANGKNKAGVRRPSILALSRQGMPNLAGTSFEGAAKGAYTVYGGEGKPDVLLLSTGSELANAVAAAKELEKDGHKARVVSFISWELFEEQSQQYRDSVLPPDVTARVSLEAGSTFGWHKWVGSRGIPIGVDHFGASAPAGILYKEFGVTTEAMVAAAKSLL